MKLKTVAIIAGVGVGAYLLYRFWNSVAKPISDAANAAGNAIAKPIAELIAWSTMPPSMHATYNFILPDGSRINGSSVAIQTADGYNPQFTYNGIKYTVISRDAISNDYLTNYADLSQIYAAQAQNLIPS